MKMAKLMSGIFIQSFQDSLSETDMILSGAKSYWFHLLAKLQISGKVPW